VREEKPEYPVLVMELMQGDAEGEVESVSLGRVKVPTTWLSPSTGAV
jgi:hypothetical protein